MTDTVEVSPAEARRLRILAKGANRLAKITGQPDTGTLPAEEQSYDAPAAAADRLDTRGSNPWPLQEGSYVCNGDAYPLTCSDHSLEEKPAATEECTASSAPSVALTHDSLRQRLAPETATPITPATRTTTDTPKPDNSPEDKANAVTEKDTDVRPPRWPLALNAGLHTTELLRFVFAICCAYAGHYWNVPNSIAASIKLQLPGDISPLVWMLMFDLCFILLATLKHMGGGPAFINAERQHRIRCPDGQAMKVMEGVAGLLQLSKAFEGILSLMWLAIALNTSMSVYLVSAVCMYGLSA